MLVSPVLLHRKNNGGKQYHCVIHSSCIYNLEELKRMLGNGRRAKFLDFILSKGIKL